MESDPANLIIVIIIVFINTFLSLALNAINAVSIAKVKQRAEEDSKKAHKILTIKETDFASVLKVCFAFLIFIVFVILYELYIRQFFKGDAAWIYWLTIVLYSLISTYLTAILTESFPRRVAIKHAEKIAFASVNLVWVFYLIFKPLSKLISVSANGLSFLFGVRKEDRDLEEKVTEEEILNLVKEAEESGVFENNEKDLIRNIFAFDDKKVSEVMTHRTNITAVKADETIDGIVKLMEEYGYSRLPVYEEDLDDIIGIVYIKDLLFLIARGEDEGKVARDILREAIYVPEFNDCTTLLKTLREKKVHMAIVVDEYGGTDGLITMEDLLEFIVGDIEDEFDKEGENGIEVLTDGSYVFDGDVSIEDVERTVEYDLFEDQEYCETIAGFMINNTGRIPDKGEQVQIKDYIITVLKSDKKSIQKIKIEKIQDSEQQE